MTPFSRPTLRLRYPKCYTNGTEPRKNRAAKEALLKGDRQILQTKFNLEKYRRKTTRSEIRNCVHSIIIECTLCRMI